MSEFRVGRAKGVVHGELLQPDALACTVLKPSTKLLALVINGIYLRSVTGDAEGVVGYFAPAFSLRILAFYGFLLLLLLLLFTLTVAGAGTAAAAAAAAATAT